MSDELLTFFVVVVGNAFMFHSGPQGKRNTVRMSCTLVEISFMPLRNQSWQCALVAGKKCFASRSKYVTSLGSVH